MHQPCPVKLKKFAYISVKNTGQITFASLASRYSYVFLHSTPSFDLSFWWIGDRSVGLDRTANHLSCCPQVKRCRQVGISNDVGKSDYLSYISTTVGKMFANENSNRTAGPLNRRLCPRISHYASHYHYASQSSGFSGQYIRTLSWLVAASKLHNNRAPCFTVESPYCPVPIQ